MTTEPTGFLYPFIEAEERDGPALTAELVASARAKMADSVALRVATLERCHDAVDRAAEAIAARFQAGGRLFAYGNGGSATDADGTVELFTSPPHGRPLAAQSLLENSAVLTALANDIGFDLVFSRQIIAHGRTGDIAIGFSTSGDSVNVIRALEEARRRGLLTIGLCGYEGGAMAGSGAIEHCLVVRSDSVHRIQEAQDTLVFHLWSAVQRHLAPRGQTS
jgi:D-sedoheptulose 7-phosphate isomerase